MENSLIALAHSVVGASHEKGNKPCQDSSLSLAGEAHRFIAVADGHGGDPYFRSDAGSELAVQAARECITDTGLMKKMGELAGVGGGAEEEREAQILHLKKSVLGRWKDLVSEHLKATPFREDELAAIPKKYAASYRGGEKCESAYGTTLIAALWAEHFILALQIGDGSCVTLDAGGGFHMPMPIDEKCFLNATTSMCDSDAIGEFHHFYTEALPVAIIIASDGVDDSFGFNEPSSSPDGLYGFYRVMTGSLAEKPDYGTAWDELKDYLPRLSKKGSGDDISIAVVADLPLLRQQGATLFCEICKDYRDDVPKAGKKYKKVQAKISHITKTSDRPCLVPTGASGDIDLDKQSTIHAYFDNEGDLSPLKANRNITISAKATWANHRIVLSGCRVVSNG